MNKKKINELRAELLGLVNRHYTEIYFNQSTARLEHAIGILIHTEAPSSIAVIKHTTQCIGYICALKDSKNVSAEICTEFINVLTDIREEAENELSSIMTVPIAFVKPEE